MKVYIVRAYYNHEGCGNPVKGFVDQNKANDLRDDLNEWLKEEPQCYNLIANSEKQVTDEEWEEFDKVYSSWQSLHETASVFADKFIVEELEIEE